MKAAIFGDIGGHAQPFINSLESLGVNTQTGAVPDDLCIIQLGDLIHKGPHSEIIIEIADRALTHNPQRWLQLLGNHEMQHLGGYNFYPCQCSLKLQSTLAQWVEDGKAVLTAGISHDAQPGLLEATESLLSHAGITRNFWKNTKAGEDLLKGGLALHASSRKNFIRLNAAGLMLGGNGPRPSAGPVWAHSTEEVYPSWLEIDMPFNQIHGHTAPYSWEFGQWFPGTRLVWRKALTTHQGIRATSFRPAPESRGSFVALDPGFEKNTPSVAQVPFLLLENYKQIF